MRMRVVPLLAAAFQFLLLTAIAQHSSKAAETKQVNSSLPRKAVFLSGQISLDGKSLVSDKNEIWAVTNPEVLSGHEGQQVRVRCQMLSAKYDIQVFSFEPVVREVKSASNRSDSAFRR